MQFVAVGQRRRTDRLSVAEASGAAQSQLHRVVMQDDKVREWDLAARAESEIIEANEVDRG